MLALAEDEAVPRNSHGTPLAEATDPTIRWNPTHTPTVDYQVRALSDAQRAYYSQYDTDPKNPMNRAGHMWGVSKAD